ncbi:hypothetical protein L211DRAFT_530000 [Terfezia boudieri ATCC MYA-4762]|uniref:Uncharacterized protein n=1 Tax=Terfezia boudieri ATCC MYA-4762 TaxID=1051890 RepID=A0A3N4LFK3_9PEZI|nr:hypothetical protein L211DRAFT_530000 [Terfezia boudieri ATCC MYA-4762]
MGKKHHQSKRQHRSRDGSSHHSSQTSINFTIPDHPSGIPPPLPSATSPLPSPLLPPLPTETSSFNSPLPPSTPPRQPRPVIVRQHGLYTYHNSTPRHETCGQVRDEFGIFNEKPWPGPLPCSPKGKEVVRDYGYDSEKGISNVNTEAFDGGEPKDSTPPSPRKRRLICVLMLTLMIVFFLATPIAIGKGISIAKKKNNNSNSNVNEASDSNGLSYGDWFCGGCRCVEGQDALAKCLEGLNINTRQ